MMMMMMYYSRTASCRENPDVSGWPVGTLVGSIQHIPMPYPQKCFFRGWIWIPFNA